MSKGSKKRPGTVKALYDCETSKQNLQPFEDVNKRVSRLAANIPLIQNNLLL